MASAKYTLLIPTHDEQGQPLRVAEAVYHHLTINIGVEAATVNHGHPFDSLIAWAEDTPETDSTFKQLAVYAGEVANVPVVHVTKQGKNAVSWPMRNPHYQPQMAAETVALHHMQMPQMPPQYLSVHQALSR